MDPNTELCPWCGSSISRAKFVEIQTRIREQEQKKLSQAKAELRKQLVEKYNQDLEAQRRATEKAAKEDAEKLVAKAASEKNQAVEKLKLVEARQSTTAKQLQEEVEKRKHLEQKHQHDLAAAEQAAEKQAQEQAELQRQKELNEQRQILEKAKNQELLKKQAEFNREREAMQKKILEMDRQLQKKTANEIGDGAEIDLFELLRETFPHDQITRTPKGQPGADILHEVAYKGEPCGRIIIDSKNRQAWQHTFVSKLRQDQMEAKADHAILSTAVFPSGKKELCIESLGEHPKPANDDHLKTGQRRHPPGH